MAVRTRAHVRDRRRSFQTLKVFAVLMLLAGMRCSVVARDLDRARDADPCLQVRVQEVYKFDPRLKPLWLQALARPESDLKRQTIEAVLQVRALGMLGWEDVATRFLAELEAADASSDVCGSAARALIILDVRSAAPALMKYSQKVGFNAARLIEPALMRWQYGPMKPVWLARLRDPRTATGSLHLALRAVAATKMTDAIPSLRLLAIDQHVASGSRVEAARALAALQPDGLENDARKLSSAKSPQQIIDRLVAATLLVHHKGSDAEELLVQLAADEEPVVAVVAGGRLLEIHPARLKPLVDSLAKNGDPGLRMLAARAWHEYASQESVEHLAPILKDPHLGVRGCAREALIQLASNKALRASVEKSVLQVLNDNDHLLGVEQAARIAGVVHYRSAAKRLLQVLENRNPAGIAAAWALRSLADPKTAAAISDWLQSETKKSGNAQVPKEKEAAKAFFAYWEATHRELEHLLEAVGALRYRPAAPLLLKYLPVPPPKKDQGQSVSALYQDSLREAAAWSLGYMVDPQADWTNALQKALASQGDTPKMMAMAAVSLGRMKSKDSLPLLQKFYEEVKSAPVVHCGCAWALEKITGKPTPTVPRTIDAAWHEGWFLEPLN